MTPAICLGVLLVLVTSCATATTPAARAPIGHQPGEEAAVLAAMDRYIRAISAGDLGAMAALQTRDGMTYQATSQREGGASIVGRPNTYWVDPAVYDGQPVRERYWSPTVLVRGAIAVVWAPYEFWTGGKTSHCGVDVFDFVKVDGEWRVANSMWTVEPDACGELRPAAGEVIRPAD